MVVVFYVVDDSWLCFVCLCFVICLGAYAWWYHSRGVPFNVLRDWSNIPNGSMKTLVQSNRPAAQSIVLTTVVVIGTVFVCYFTMLFMLSCFDAVLLVTAVLKTTKKLF